ncbi:MAG TPA: helix-turn-helix transcriptional regulator [Streptomyces sp.]|jgi:AraC-like DNA-binding protein|nr:helix-turn-helix transcriptional regulator [Streptomyces sp.]
MNDISTDADRRRHRPERNVFETTDPEAGHAFMNAAYGASLRMSGTEHDHLLRHARYDMGTFCLDDVTLPMETGYKADPLQTLAVVEPRTGWLEHESEGVGERLGPEEVAIISPPDLPFSARTHNLDFESVLLDMPLLAQVADTAEEAGGEAPGPLRFTSLQPVSPGSAAQWRCTVTHVREVLATSFEAMNEPLVLGDTARLLAASALATFPNTAVHEPTSRDRNDATPTTFHKAAAFIEENVHTDIGLPEIAAAVSVSPRALQYAFVRHNGGSLYGHLRRVRLERAHFDLLDADPTDGATVSAIAARWGFARAGNFAAHYRDIYGVSPDNTLAI